MEIIVPKDGITGLFDKLSEKVFKEGITCSQYAPFKVRYNRSISVKLRNVVYSGLLSPEHYDGEDTRADKDHQFAVRERLSIVSYTLKANGLTNKANKLEKLISKLDFQPNNKSTFTGHLNILNEVEAILKVVLALSNYSKLMTQDACEVWRKVDSSYQFLKMAQPYQSSDSYTTENQDSKVNLDYQYYPSEMFEVFPCFGVPKKNFERQDVSFQVFIQEPGTCGLNKWFSAQRDQDPFSKKTRCTLYNALIHSRTNDIDVKLSLPDLPRHPERRLYTKSKEATMISEDEGFVEVLDESELPRTNGINGNDSGVYDLNLWDKALDHKPSTFHTWEGRKQIPCKPFFTEAGPEVINHLYDMRITEASYLINSQPSSFKYLQMTALIRDGLMVLIGVPSQTFQLEKNSSSFLTLSTVRLSGCSPGSLHHILKKLGDIGTNYYRLNKFTTCQKHSAMVQSSVLRAFITGLRKYLQNYRKTVIVVEAKHVQSPLELWTKFRKEAYELKFLSDICMCSQGYSGESGKPKPKFPVGVKLLSYLYQLCLINVSSSVANLLLYLLKVSCTPYLRFVKQWVFKGCCIDMYKEFMITENHVYLASRDKYYWTHGYVMSSTTTMDGVPVFLKDLAEDMFTCGKSINLLKLCFPDKSHCSTKITPDEDTRMPDQSVKTLDHELELLRELLQHYVCNHHVNLPVMSVTYSLDSLKAIYDSSLSYCNDMKKLQEEKKKEGERLKNEEKLKREQASIEERRKANKALLEAQELLKKTKKALAEKKKEELDFLKKQMEDALKKKSLVAMEADEEDARIVRESLHYEVTSAKMDEQLKEETRRELIRYYEELSKEAERREEHAKWLARRLALRNIRESFFEQEKDKLQEMRKKMNDSMDSEKRIKVNQHEDIFDGPRKQWVIKKDVLNTIMVSEESVVGAKTDHPSYSTIQDLLYNTPEDRVTQTSVSDGMADDRVTQPSVSDRMSHDNLDTHVKESPRHPAQSTVQNLMYPSGVKEGLSESTGNVSNKISGNTEGKNDSIILLDSSTPSQSNSRSGHGNVIRIGDDATQRSTRGSPSPSTIQHVMYGGVNDSRTSTHQMSDHSKRPSLIETSVYPSLKSTRGSEPPSTIESLLYPDTVQNESVIKSSPCTRGSEPPSTIQKLLYPSTTAAEEPEKAKREPLTHEDVWLATQFEPLPDNFDILDEEPFGDIFARVIQDQGGLWNGFSGSESENVKSENDACEVLCLPVILQRCVMKPLITQIDVVNSAIVRYFMDDLRLIEHFETLKKFLLLEDGEFSYSLTRQLFEKLSAGITPQQLCCISTLNSIIAHAIQSSVYACQSENTRSLSFVLTSVPDIFKRNDIEVFNFIELRYKIEWPVNIIITENCITKYNRITDDVIAC